MVIPRLVKRLIQLMTMKIKQMTLARSRPRVRNPLPQLSPVAVQVLAQVRAQVANLVLLNLVVLAAVRAQAQVVAKQTIVN